jgi:putative membrane protein
MLLRWALAAVHLLALGIGLGAVHVRAKSLQGRLDREGINRVFVADSWWAVAAVLWISTGLWRLFGATEKSTEYYLGNHVFWTKMALFVGVILMEIRPMLTLMRWRRDVARGIPPETSSAARLARISHAQSVLILLIILAATAMARGIGGR